MLAVLSTLSGTIAIKQYFNIMKGCIHFKSTPYHIVNFLTLLLLHVTICLNSGLICIPLTHVSQVGLHLPPGTLTWLNWHKNAVTTATWQLLLTGS